MHLKAFCVGIKKKVVLSLIEQFLHYSWAVLKFEGTVILSFVHLCVHVCMFVAICP